VARAALRRTESRGGHTRDDYPAMDPKWRRVNLVCSLDGTEVQVKEQPLPAMPPELLALFEWSELSKYMTGEELEAVPGAPRDAQLPAGDTGDTSERA
jgi:succinate dehydrogenase / fumarate reductase flavoprotein subunit